MPSQAKKAINKVQIEYIVPDEHCPLYASGVLGGPTPKSDILINFYLDITGIPKSQTFSAIDGKLSAEIFDKRIPASIKNGDTVTLYRRIQSGIILNVAEAKSFHKWLGEQIAQVQKMVDSKDNLDDVLLTEE